MYWAKVYVNFQLPTTVGPGCQEAWPQWCTGPYTLPSVVPSGQMLSSCHTRRWCNQSECSRWCSCRTLSIWGAMTNLFCVLRRNRGCRARFKTVLACLHHDSLLLMWHQGTWSSWPSPLQPRRWEWGHAWPSFSCSPQIHTQNDLVWSYSEIIWARNLEYAS